MAFTFAPDPGRSLVDVKVDGVSVLSEVVSNNNKYTFTDVQGAHTLEVLFIVPSFTITASVSGGGGTVSPEGAVSVEKGASRTFAFAPAGGCRLKDVMLDGASVMSSVSGGAYTLTDVKANHALTAYFEAISTPAPSPSPSSGGGDTPIAIPQKPIGIAVPVIGGGKRVTTPVEVSGDTAIVSKPSDEELKGIVQAAAEKHRPIVLDMSSIADSCTNIEIPSNIIAAAGDPSSGVDGFKVETPNGTDLKFDTAAAGKLAGAANGGTVRLSAAMRPANMLTNAERTVLGVRDVAAIIDIGINANGEMKDLGGGSVEVTTKAILISGDPKDYKLFIDGVEVEFTAVKMGKNLYSLKFKTSTLGTFMLAGEKGE